MTSKARYVECVTLPLVPVTVTRYTPRGDCGPEFPQPLIMVVAAAMRSKPARKSKGIWRRLNSPHPKSAASVIAPAAGNAPRLFADVAKLPDVIVMVTTAAAPVGVKGF